MDIREAFANDPVYLLVLEHGYIATKCNAST